MNDEQIVYNFIDFDYQLQFLDLQKMCDTLSYILHKIWVSWFYSYFSNGEEKEDEFHRNSIKSW